jgi:arginine/lysine/ornithine decarboxylase
VSNTPLYDFLVQKAERNEHRFFLPGHKGVPQLKIEPERIDFTELEDTGDLYRGDEGPIREAERLCAEAYGAEECFFLTGGSTMGIQVAVSLICREGDRLLAARQSHRALCGALTLTGGDADFIGGEHIAGFGISRGTGGKEVEAALGKIPEVKYSAVFITSPSCYGVLSDVRGIANICHERGLPLIVDGAHGAHLPFISPDKNPISNGADIVLCSAHKTLGCLGQGAMLLVRDMSYLGLKAEYIRNTMSIFGTSSPSYVIMASIDLSRARAQEDGGRRLRDTAKRCRDICGEINRSTRFKALCEKDTRWGIDDMRLTINSGRAGLSGRSLAGLLQSSRSIICEMCDEVNAVLIVTGADDEEKLASLLRALKEIDGQTAPPEGSAPPAEAQLPPAAEKVMTPREAYLSKPGYVRLRDAEGLVSGEELSIYPPGIPVIIPGERIGKKTIAFLEKKGYNVDREILAVSPKNGG